MSFFISAILPMFLLFSLGIVIWLAFFVDLEKLADGSNDIHRALILVKRVAITVSLLIIFAIVMGRYYLDTYHSQPTIDYKTTEEELREFRQQREDSVSESSITYRERTEDNSRIEARDRSREMTDWRKSIEE